MEAMMNNNTSDNFQFSSACTSPYASAPSSPNRFGNLFYSAPTSPNRVHNNDFSSSSKVSFASATSSNYGDAEDREFEDTDFAFDFNFDTCSLSADELFDGGKIKPLKLPPIFHYDQKKNFPLDSPKSPRSPKKMIREAFSPRKRDFDPFEAALEKTRKEKIQENGPDSNIVRGRERTTTHVSSSSNSRHKKGTRSLSPFRVSDLLFEPEELPEKNPNSYFSSFWNKNWKIKDLLLFRSASEGHATHQKSDQIKEYEVKNSSFRSTESVGSTSSRRRSSISAHELHYTVNRAVSEEMRRRTFLPYKQGLLGCLGFNPVGSSNGGSLSRR